MSNIAAHAEAVAKAYWGEPAMRRGHILRWGTHGSKELDLRKGTWFDFENNEGGGVVDLVRKNEGATILGSIPDILEKKFGIQKQAQVSLQPARFMSACYDYIDEHGEVRYQVRRYEPKTFRQCRPDGKGGWLYNMDGVEALPYNLHQILARPDDPVFIVEGEKAAEKVATIGLLATTSHGGAKKWQPVLNKWFEGRNVIVLPDNDEAGKAHADMVVANLFGVANRIKRVELPDLPEKGDIVDWLVSNDRDALMGAVKATPVIEAAPEPVAEADDYNNDNNSDLFEFVGADYIRNMPPIDWVIGEGDKGIITQHGLSVMYGAPGAGKSFVALDMALSICTGTPWQGIPTRQGKVLYIAGEGVGGLGKRLKAWEAHNGVREGGNLKVLPIAVNFREQSEVEKLMRSIDAVGDGWTAVFVDTVARSLVGADENSATELGLWVAAADSLKAHCKCALIGIHHSGKDSTRGMRGSSALLGAVDTSLAVTKDEDLVYMRCEKQKDAEPADEQVFQMTDVALIDGSSIVLTRLDGEKPAKKKRPRALSINQQLALEALRNVVIDTGNKVVSASLWHEEHRQKCPDLARQRAGEARHALIEAGLVAADKNKVWLVNDNNDL